MSFKISFSICTIFFFSSLAIHAQKVGLVLSGGGARGLAHIGVIKALEENNIPIDYITGSSAGAIVGCMYSLGYSGLEMDSIVHTDDFYNWANGIIEEDYTYYFRKQEPNASWISLKFSLDSVFSTSLPTNIVSSIPYDYALMEDCAGAIAKADYNFDSLFIPFRCTASDIENKETIIFSKGDLATAVRASSAYPFYFRPVLHGGKILYDGGMYNNFPVDVMLKDFQPDIIIGVNAAGTNTPTSENNIITQIRAMMTTPTNFSVVCENGILIEANTDRFGLFDFSSITEIIEEGYNSTIKQLERLKINIQKRADPVALQERRKSFRSSFKPVLIDRVFIEGADNKQAYYIKQILKPDNNPIPINKLKASYFQLMEDPNIKNAFPSLTYNKSTGYFDLSLRISKENNLITQFGGNLCSKPVSQAFVGIQYNIWRKKSYNFSGNVYFGKLYTSGQLSVRMDSPSRLRYFLEAVGTINQYDFYRSSSQFFTEQKPSYILQSDYTFGLQAGIPVRNKGKLVGNVNLVRISNDYYQTEDFLQNDTADESIVKGPAAGILFERNTLNRKQYASQGTFLSMKINYFNVRENTIPGSTSIDRTQQINYHDWFSFRVTYENYFKRFGPLRIGLFGELSVTDIPFMANYTNSVLLTPAFTPIQESKTIYLPFMHAHDYAGVGMKNAIAIKSNVELRLEGYVFQPYRALLQTTDKKTIYSDPFEYRYYSASAGAVFHSPLGPIGFFVNYFDRKENSISFLFHFGYFIFNKSALN